MAGFVVLVVGLVEVWILQVRALAGESGAIMLAGSLAWVSDSKEDSSPAAAAVGCLFPAFAE